MWPKFDDSSISMKEVITTILWWIDQKNHNLGLAQDPTLAFYTSLEKWFKLIVRSLGGYFLRYMEKLVGGLFNPHPE